MLFIMIVRVTNMNKLLLTIISMCSLLLSACSNDGMATVYSTTFVTTNTNPMQIAFQIGSIVLIVAVIVGIVVWIKKRK